MTTSILVVLSRSDYFLIPPVSGKNPLQHAKTANFRICYVSVLSATFRTHLYGQVHEQNNDNKYHFQQIVTIQPAQKKPLQAEFGILAAVMQVHMFN